MDSTLFIASSIGSKDLKALNLAFKDPFQGLPTNPFHPFRPFHPFQDQTMQKGFLQDLAAMSTLLADQA